ncbi:MAG: hypothetical protein Q8L09_02300 [Candidatus Moranbacteria bacterium]|nr:hypothetical protein [Candidatus Moranbacteria bacterium]
MEDKCPNCGEPTESCKCESSEEKSGCDCSCCGHPCEPEEK